MADAKLTALTAASALAAADLFYVSQSAASRKATGTQFLTLVGTTYAPIASPTFTGAVTVPAGTLAAPAVLITGSDATTGVYSPAANQFAIAISGVQRFFVSGSGTYSDGVLGNFSNTGYLAIGGALDTRLYRDAASTFAQRNGTTQQIFRLYNTYTDASNYERLTLTGVAGTSVNITAETLGTGGDNLDIVLTPAGSGRTKMSGGLTLTSGGLLLSGFGSGLDNYASGLRLGNAGEVAWCVSAGNSAVDTAFLRGAAGQVDVTNGTAATYRDLKLRNLLAGGGNGSYVQTPSMTVANLAAAATAGAGARAFVTDANATTFLSTVAAGGANKVPVVSDGTNWLIG